MITLMSIQTVAAGREADYEKIQRFLYSKTHGVEPGVIRYEHFRGTKPGQYYSLLTFRSFEEFLQHQLAPYHDEVDWEGLFSELHLQWLDPLPGASELEPSVVPALAADADEKTRKYAAMLTDRRPAWWDALKGATGP